MATQAEHYLKRFESLRSERSEFIGFWQQLSDYHMGHKGRFLVTDRNKAKRNTKMINNTSLLASRTLASGMMAGITSPARPWFKLGTPDPELLEYAPVKEWLHDVEALMREVFAKSNLYNSLHSVYAETGVFATGSMGIYSDFKNIIRTVPYTIGSYVLATNGRHEVDTFGREYQLSVGQLVKQYGLENCTASTQNNWKRGNTESWVDVLHIVEPNDDSDMMRPDSKNMPTRSIYMEKSAKGDQFLKKSGFEEFPILTPRWDVTGSDIYGNNCPGMDALGDTKALQLEEKRKAQAIDKLVDPPTQAPTSLQNAIGNGGFMPGETTFVSDTSNGIKPIYDIRPDINALSMDIRENEFRIKRAFYEDMFLMLANTDRRQVTAREIEEKHEEKLLMLGPVLERLHNELLDPLIDRTFNIMQRAGILPPAPEELNDVDLRVEYISVLAQAQKLTALTGIERLTGFAGQLATIWPEARHKVDPEQAIDEYAQSIGTSPRMIRSDEEVKEILGKEAQQQQMQQLAASAQPIQQGTQALKNLTEADTTGDITRALGL